MLKKYFALSLIAASVALASCSSNDDDDDDGNTTPPAANAANDSSAFDIVANSPDHTTLASAVTAAGLADTLDNPGTAFTIFAPTNAAFEALDAAEAGTVAALLADSEALTRVLTYHVLGKSLTETDIANALNAASEESSFTEVPLLADSMLTIATGTETSYTVSDGTVSPGLSSQLIPMGEGAMGVVYSIDAVLTPPAEMTSGGMNPGGDMNPGDGSPSEGAGTAQAALESAGNYTNFLAVFDPINYDTNAWTVFAPTDAVSAGATIDAQNHIVVNDGALTIQDMITAGQITVNSNQVFTVTGTGADDLMVGGFPVTQLVTGDAGTIVYSIGGVLAP